MSRNEKLGVFLGGPLHGHQCMTDGSPMCGNTYCRTSEIHGVVIYQPMAVGLSAQWDVMDMLVLCAYSGRCEDDRIAQSRHAGLVFETAARFLRKHMLHA